VNVPLDEQNDLALETDRWVYAEFILRQSWLALQGRPQICLPQDYRLLIETVYGAEEPETDSPLAKAWAKLQDQEADARQQAQLRLLPAPDPEDSFTGAAARLQFEEDENSAAWIVAQTRLAEESVTVIPLERHGNDALFSPEKQVRLDAPAPREVQLQLLRRSLRIAHRDVVRALKEESSPLPRLFTESPLLKGYLPLWLRQGQTLLTTGRNAWQLKLDSQLGLVISKEKRGEK
jgi:hypothetical protein